MILLSSLTLSLVAVDAEAVAFEVELKENARIKFEVIIVNGCQYYLFEDGWRDVSVFLPSLDSGIFLALISVLLSNFLLLISVELSLLFFLG